MQGNMQRVAFSCLAAFAILCTPIANAIVDPVTAADLIGKMLCWDEYFFNGSQAFDPSKDTYGEGGKFSGEGVGEGTWAITPDGVKIDTETRHLIDNMQKSPNGTFTSDLKFWSGRLKATGKYCNQ